MICEWDVFVLDLVTVLLSYKSHVFDQWRRLVASMCSSICSAIRPGYTIYVPLYGVSTLFAAKWSVSFNVFPV